MCSTTWRAGRERGARLWRLRHDDRSPGSCSNTRGFSSQAESNPRNFVAQPTLALSTCPTCAEEGVALRHVNLRPFVLAGRDGIRIVPGGLTASH